MQSRVENSAKNIIYRLLGQIVTIATRFISRSIFIWILGAVYLGVEGLFGSVLQMLSLADLGLSSVMVYSMYKPLSENDENKLAALVGFYKKIYNIIALAVFFIGISIMPVLKYIVNIDGEMPHLYLYYFLYLMNTVASYLVVYKTCILNADQKAYVVSKYEALFGVFSTIATTAFLIITKNFLVYLIVQVMFTYCKNFYCSYVAQKMYPYISNKSYVLPKQEQKTIFNTIKSGFIYKFSITLVSSSTNMVISMLVNTLYVGLYSNYTMIVNNITFVINMIFSSFTASIGNLLTYGDKNKNYSVYETMQTLSFIFGSIVISCVYNLVDDFVALWIGKEFVLSPIVIVAIVINMYFSIVLMPIWSYREAAGLYNKTKYVMLCTAGVNIVCSLVLGKIFGLAGILFATSIARLSTYFWYEPKILFKDYFDKTVSNYYLKVFANLVVTIIVCGSVFAITKLIVVSSWITWLLKASLCGIISTLMVIAFYFKSPRIKDIINYVKVVFVKKHK